MPKTTEERLESLEKNQDLIVQVLEGVIRNLDEIVKILETRAIKEKLLSN